MTWFAPPFSPESFSDSRNSDSYLINSIEMFTPEAPAGVTAHGNSLKMNDMKCIHAIGNLLT